MPQSSYTNHKQIKHEIVLDVVAKNQMKNDVHRTYHDSFALELQHNAGASDFLAGSTEMQKPLFIMCSSVLTKCPALWNSHNITL